MKRGCLLDESSDRQKSENDQLTYRRGRWQQPRKVRTNNLPRPRDGKIHHRANTSIGKEGEESEGHHCLDAHTKPRVERYNHPNTVCKAMQERKGILSIHQDSCILNSSAHFPYAGLSRAGSATLVILRCGVSRVLYFGHTQAREPSSPIHTYISYPRQLVCRSDFFR